MKASRWFRSPLARTMALSFVLGAIGLSVTLHSALGVGARRLVAERPVALVAMALLFFLAEQYLITVEFRRESHSMTFAGVPLALGIILLPTHELVLARLVAASVVFAIQRVSLEKTIYNTAAYAFEAAVTGSVVHELLGSDVPLTLGSAVVLLVTIAAGDQLMSALVLVVIRLHAGAVPRRDVAEIMITSVVLSGVTTVIAITGAVLLHQDVFGYSLVALLVGFAILIYRAYTATNRRHQALEVVHDFVATSVGAQSLEALGHHALSRMRQMLRASAAELILRPRDPAAVDGGAHYLRIAVDEEDVPVHSVLDGYSADWVLAKALEHGEPTLLPRSSKDPAVRRWLAGQGLTDAIAAPLLAGEDVLGAVVISDRLGESLTFTDDDRTLLQT